jgi:hypothetical protein
MNNLEQLGKRMAEHQDRYAVELEQAVPPPSAALGEHLLRRATERRRRRQMTLVSLTAVVLAVGTLAGLRLWPTHDRATVATVRAQAGQRVAASALDLALAFDDGSRVVLSSGASLRTDMVGPSSASLELERGRAAVRVIHTRATHWTVRAGAYQVLVTGTKFRLDWRPESGALAVVVEEGSVRVTGGLLNEAVDIGAGQSLALEQGSPVGNTGAAVGAPRTPGPAPTSDPLLEAAPPTFPTTPVGSEPPPSRGRRPVTASVTPSITSSTSPTSWREQAEAGRYRDAIREAERRGFEEICRESSGADLLTLAEAARFAGRTERAEQALKAVRSRFGHGEDAAVAAESPPRTTATTPTPHAGSAPISPSGRVVGWIARLRAVCLNHWRSWIATPPGKRPASTCNTTHRDRTPPSRETCLGCSSASARAKARGLVCASILALVLADTGASFAADEIPRVALIEDPGETTIFPRLHAELTGLGLDVQTVAKNESEQLPRDIIEAARATSAVAAFRIVVEGDRADVWIADRVTGKVVLREMLPRGAKIDGRVVALRAVELLRVSLMELDVRRTPQSEPPPTMALTESSGLLPDLERFSLSTGSSFLWSPGGCGPGIGIAAAVAWRPTWIGARLSGGSVLAPATITRPEGTGEVTTRWLALDAALQPRKTRIAWRPRAGLGVAALSTSLHGVPTGPRQAYKQTVYTLSPMASFDLGWTVHSRVRLGLGVAYLRPVRGIEILIAGDSVGGYGRDIFLANLGLDIVLP